MRVTGVALAVPPLLCLSNLSNLAYADSPSTLSSGQVRDLAIDAEEAAAAAASRSRQRRAATPDAPARRPTATPGARSRWRPTAARRPASLRPQPRARTGRTTAAAAAA